MKGPYIYNFLMTMVLLISSSGCVKSEQNLRCNRQKNLEADKNFLYSCPLRENLTLTLPEIMEIALSRNLELKVKELEYEIQREAATGAWLNLLPELLTNAEVNNRYNSTGATSESLEPGVPPAPPSISSDKHNIRWNTTLTWSLLDFGISYFRARQEANKILIHQLEIERLRQNIALEICKNFWNMVASKEAIDRTLIFLEHIGNMEVLYQKASDSRLVAYSRVLETRDNIYRRRIKLKEYQKEFIQSKNALLRSMGLPPATDFQISYDIGRSIANIDDIYSLEEAALMNRPDIISYDVEEKIGIDEVRVAILGYIPGVSLFTAYDYNDNRFLLNNWWNTIGIKAAWDLFNIPAGMSKERLARKQKQLARRNRLALSLAVLSQVHLAYSIYLDDLENFDLAQQSESLKSELLDSAEFKKTVGRFDVADLIDYKSEFLDAEIMCWKNYADLQFSLEQVNNAIGISFYYRIKPEDVVNKTEEDKQVEKNEDYNFAA